MREEENAALSEHERYMRTALELAEKGRGFVNPNPMVGAVIVKNGKVIGSGYHESYGGPHAERNALASCAESPEGATLYVTLEPCCHHGKNPPCTDAVIESKIKTVVIGSGDPNPLVAGKGIELLRQNGIEVITYILEEECVRLSRIFFHYIQEKTPYTAIKYAMTLDGKIASCTGESKWITGTEAREHVHGLRHEYAAIMVGVDTVIADDPMLNCRLAGSKDPTRVIADTNLRIPLSSKIVQTARDIPTYIACGNCSLENAAHIEKIRELENQGCRVLQVEKDGEGHVDLKYLMAALYEEKIDSVLVEGGSGIHFSALNSGIVRKAYVYVAPKMIGGVGAKSPVGGLGIEKLEDAFFFTNRTISVLDEDILLEYEVVDRKRR